MSRILRSALVLAVLAVSAGSAGSVAVAQSGPGAPGAPQVDGPRGNGTMTVAWSAASGSGVVYDVVYSSDYRRSWSRAATGISAARYTLTGLHNDATYVVAVLARNAHGNSHWVNSAPFGPEPAPGLPGVPFVQYFGRGDGTLPLLWRVSNSPNVVYDVVYSSDFRQSWTRAATGANVTACNKSQAGGHNWANSTCWTINGPLGAPTGQLDNQATYVVAVRARSTDTGRSSGWVNSNAFLPLEEPRVISYPTACLSTTDYVMFVHWPKLPESGVALQLRYKIDNGSWVNLPAEDEDTPDHRKLRGGSSPYWLEWMDQLPTAANSYTVTVQVKRSKTVGGETVESPWGSSTFQAGTTDDVRRWLTRCPTAPTNLTGSAVTSNSITATWNAVSGPHDYDIRYRTTAATSWTTATTGHPSTSYTITGLQPGTSYRVEVRARMWDTAQASAWTSFTATTTSLGASSVTATTASLAIANHAGSWYVKETAPAQGTCSSAIAAADAHDLSNLSASTDYTYKAYSDSACTTEIATVTFTTAEPRATLQASAWATPCITGRTESIP